MIESRVASVRISFGNPLRFLCSDATDVIRPPARLTLPDWADRHRWISAEVNPVESGQWHTDRAEYLRGAMEAITEPDVYKIPIMKSSRSGFTAAIGENTVGYHIHADPTTIIYFVPTKEKALDFSKMHFTPMVRDSECLRDKVKPTRSKDAENTLLTKKFPGGWFKCRWATSAINFRQDTARVVIGDDVDGWPHSVQGEGNPIALMERRTRTVWNRKIIVISNPTIAGSSLIEFEYANSTQGHYYVPCPRCAHMQILVFGKDSVFARPTNGKLIGGLVNGYVHPQTGAVSVGLRFDSENCSWACYVCEGCGYLIPESKKFSMVARGEWRHLNVAGAQIVNGQISKGFHLSEFYSTFNATWLGEAQEFLTAKQSSENLRVWVNNIAGETFEEEAFTISDHILQERLEEWEKLPHGVLALTAGVDLQGDRIEYFVWGWGENLERWHIDHQVFFGSPYDNSLWNRFDAYVTSTEYVHESGMRLMPRCIFIDSGFSSHDVYRFTASREKREVRGHIVSMIAVKGHDGRRPLIKAGTRDRGTRASLLILGQDDAIGNLYESLKHQPPKDMAQGFPAGYVHLNKRFGTLEFLRQLSAKRRLTIWTKHGAKRLVWDLPANRRDEAQDGAVYAYCAKEFINPNFVMIRQDLEKKARGLSLAQIPIAQTKTIVAQPQVRIIKDPRGGTRRSF